MITIVLRQTNGRAISDEREMVRKVRASQGRMPDNVW